MAHPGIDVIRQLLGTRSTEAVDLLERRANLAALAGSPPAPDGVAVEAIELAGRRAERLVPAGAPADRAVIYLHGGGYCSGSIDTHRAIAGALALAAGIEVVNLDYRLAPEHPFPAALDDVLAAFDALGTSGALGQRRLALAGDSAGGGLALAAAVALRDREAAVPAAVVGFSPWTDLTQTSASMAALADRDPMVTKEVLDPMASAYLAGADPRAPLASPRFAELGGLPPLHLNVGSDETLLDDTSVLAERARAAGVEVQVRVWPEMIHVFQAFPAELVPEAAESIAAAAAFLAHHLTPPKLRS